MNPFQIDIPVKVLFGAGQLDRLHEQVLPGKKALIVISSGRSTRANGYLDRTEKELAAAGAAAEVFAGIQANPTLESVGKGAQAARAMGADMIVALGGGSVMDAAKAIALMAVNEGNLGLCGVRHWKGPKICPPGPAGDRHHHHGRHRIGSGCHQCDHQPGNP